MTPASPVLRAFCTTWSDALDGEHHQALGAVAERLPDGAVDSTRERIRAEIAVTWAARVATVAALEAQGLDAQAEDLLRLEPVDANRCDRWTAGLRRAGDAARSLAGEAWRTTGRGHAARAAGWRATRAAGVSAARTAAETAIGCVDAGDAAAAISIAEVAEEAEVTFAWSASATAAQHVEPTWEAVTGPDLPGLDSMVAQLQPSALELVDQLLVARAGA